MVSTEMTGPTLTRAEQRAFVLALMDVEPRDWWWKVIVLLPNAPFALIDASARLTEQERRECLLAAADLLRPRYSREEAESAVVNVPSMLALGTRAQQLSAYERAVRMITGEEP